MHLAILRMLPGGGGRTVSLQMLRNSTCSSHAELLLTVWGCGKPIPHVPERQQNGMAISLRVGRSNSSLGKSRSLSRNQFLRSWAGTWTPGCLISKPFKSCVLYLSLDQGRSQRRTPKRDSPHKTGWVERMHPPRLGRFTPLEVPGACYFSRLRATKRRGEPAACLPGLRAGKTSLGQQWRKQGTWCMELALIWSIPSTLLSVRSRTYLSWLFPCPEAAPASPPSLRGCAGRGELPLIWRPVAGEAWPLADLLLPLYPTECVDSHANKAPWPCSLWEQPDSGQNICPGTA